MTIQQTALRAADDAPRALIPEAILQLGLGFWGSKTLLSAVELGVFTELGDGPVLGDELAARLGLHPRSSWDFLDALVALGMLERDDGAYGNTPHTALCLDRSSPSYIGGMLEMADALSVQRSCRPGRFPQPAQRPVPRQSRQPKTRPTRTQGRPTCTF